MVSANHIRISIPLFVPSSHHLAHAEIERAKKREEKKPTLHVQLHSLPKQMESLVVRDEVAQICGSVGRNSSYVASCDPHAFLNFTLHYAKVTRVAITLPLPR